MPRQKFSPAWKKSRQPRKQRKYLHRAPLHLRQKLFHVHLSPELRKKYGFRNVLVRKGDKVRILRGQFSKKEGRIDRLNLKRGLIFVSGIEVIKKDGTKIPFALKPSHLMITELGLEDKLRRSKLESKYKIKK